MLRSDLAPARSHVAAWADKLVAQCRERLSVLLPLNKEELEFLRRLNEAGEIAPQLITSDPAMQTVLRKHPGLKWKAFNVRKHRGLDGDERGDEES